MGWEPEKSVEFGLNRCVRFSNIFHYIPFIKACPAIDAQMTQMLIDVYHSYANPFSATCWNMLKQSWGHLKTDQPPMPHDRSQIGGWWKNAISLVVVERLAGVWGDKLAEFLEVVAFACGIQFRWVSFFKKAVRVNYIERPYRKKTTVQRPHPLGSGEDETCHQPRGGAKVQPECQRLQRMRSKRIMYFKNTT